MAALAQGSNKEPGLVFLDGKMDLLFGLSGEEADERDFLERVLWTPSRTPRSVEVYRATSKSVFDVVPGLDWAVSALERSNRALATYVFNLQKDRRLIWRVERAERGPKGEGLNWTRRRLPVPVSSLVSLLVQDAGGSVDSIGSVRIALPNSPLFTTVSREFEGAIYPRNRTGGPDGRASVWLAVGAEGLRLLERNRARFPEGIERIA